METPSKFATFYPTSSSTLAQHSCGRLLWLPLSSCLKMAGEHVRNFSTSSSLPPLSQQSKINSFARGGGGGGSIGFDAYDGSGADDDLVSGFELRFKHACTHSPAMPMSRFRECFLANPKAAASPAPQKGKGITAGVASPAPPHYREDAKLRFLVSDDTGASQWENLDSHRLIHGVIVVVNSFHILNLSLAHVLEVVQAVFSAQYRDKVCRCYVVMGGASAAAEQVAQLLSSFPPRVFVAVDTAVPVEQTASRAMEDLGRNVVFTLNATLSELESHIVTVSSSKMGKNKADLTLLRTPLDMLAGSGSSGGGGLSLPSASSGTANGALDAMKANLIVSRLTKKRGDILTLLGATDMALKTYGDTQFASNADALWCSATLESIAGARYQQWLEELAPRLPAIAEAIVSLQSDEADWAERDHWEPKVALIEELSGSLLRRTQTALSYFKGPCVPNSMRQRLVKEVEEPLVAKAQQLERLLVKVRACLEAGTKILPSDPSAYFVGSELKLCVEEMVKVGLNELGIYLLESLRQQRHATTPNNKKTLQDRDLETRLKSVAFLADRGETEAFTRELSDVRALFSVLYGDVVQKVLRFFTFLCIRCHCRRKAIAFLVETAYNDRRNKLYASTIQSLVRACFLSGIALGSIPELNAAVLVDPLCRLYAVISTSPSSARGVLSPSSLALSHTSPTVPSSASANEADGTPVTGSTTTAVMQSANTAEPNFYSHLGGAESLHPEQGTSKRNEMALTSLTMQHHIPLLMELLDALHEADCRGSVRCQLATLLLFRYPTYLDRNQSQLLTDIARCEALRLEPHVRPATAALPFLSSWEALSLPPNLAPKTVSVGGAFFTFIDTARLKLTVLSLNGRRLNSRVVWTVGDVGTVMASLYNPYHTPMKLLTVSLQSRSCADLDEQNRLPVGAESHTTGPLAPTCYVLSNVVLPPFARTRVLLQVQPKMPGYLRIEGIELRPQHLKAATLPVQGRLPEPMGIPVLQQLPLVSCTVSVSELEVFSGQRIDFTVRVVNCGQLPIAHISLTAHGEGCLLEDCEGCKERASDSDITVVLSKAALEAARRVPLRPGDVVTIPVHVQAPPSFTEMENHFVIFRVDCSLPHDKPTMPPNVPSAVPVFGVIPRRVTETRMRVYYSPTLAVTSVRLTKDKRFVDVRLVNRSECYSVELELSSLPFAHFPNALLMAGADYVVPPIDISRVSDHGNQNGSFLYHVPWMVREIPHCTGTLAIDLGLVAEEVVCSEPLDELLLSMDVAVPAAEAGDKYLTARHWESHGSPRGPLSRARLHRAQRTHTAPSHSDDHGGDSDSEEGTRRSRRERADGGDSTSDFGSVIDAASDHGGSMASGTSMPIVLPAVTPIQLLLRASADWRRAVPLRFSLTMTNHLDVGVLSGPLESVGVVGDLGKCVCEQRFELLAFKTGEHAITITITDSAEREIAHVMRFAVQHGRD